MKNNKKKTRMTKVEKRRLAFEKRNAKKEQNLARYGAEGGSALVIAKTIEFNRRVIAAVLTLVFAVSCLVVGVNFATNAEETANVQQATYDLKPLGEDGNRQDPSGMVLNKYLERQDNGKYTLKLSAYARGETKIHTTQVPTDFILVVDQSGSMAYQDMPVDYQSVDTPTGGWKLSDFDGGKDTDGNSADKAYYYFDQSTGDYYRVYRKWGDMFERIPRNTIYCKDIVDSRNLHWFADERGTEQDFNSQYYYQPASDINITRLCAGNDYIQPGGENDYNFYPLTISSQGRTLYYSIRLNYYDSTNTRRYLRFTNNNANTTANKDLETGSCIWYKNPSGNYFGPGDRYLLIVSYNAGIGIDANDFVIGWINGNANWDSFYTYGQITSGFQSGMFIQNTMFIRHVGYNALAYRDKNGVEHIIDSTDYCDKQGQPIRRNASSNSYEYNTEDFRMNVPLYEATDTKRSRLESVKNALTSFAENVAGQTDDDGPVDHRIAIVGFSSNETTYNNTEIMTNEGFTASNNNGIAKRNASDSTYKKALISARANDQGDVNSGLTAAITNLTANGGTQPEDGLDMAYNILNNSIYKDEYANKTRNAVVIFFTDGRPGQNSESNQYTEANEVVASAWNIKRDFTTAQIYSVGVFGEADGNPLTYFEDLTDWWGASTTRVFLEKQRLEEDRIAAEAGNNSVSPDPDNYRDYQEYAENIYYPDFYKEEGTIDPTIFTYKWNYSWGSYRSSADVIGYVHTISGTFWRECIRNAEGYPAQQNDTIADYMTVVSSSYPEATSFDGNWLSNTNRVYNTVVNGARGAVSTKNYYSLASDQESLNDVFTNIANEASYSGTVEVIDSTAYLKDVISDKFELSESNFENSQVNIYRGYQRQLAGLPDFPELVESRALAATEYNVETRTISVSGFDYSGNYVGFNQAGTPGEKLEVIIPDLVLKDGVTSSMDDGADPLYSNDLGAGIYMPNDDEPVAKFVRPYVSRHSYTIKVDQGATATTNFYIVDAGGNQIQASDLQDVVIQSDKRYAYDPDKLTNISGSADGTVIYLENLPAGAQVKSVVKYEEEPGYDANIAVMQESNPVNPTGATDPTYITPYADGDVLINVNAVANEKVVTITETVGGSYYSDDDTFTPVLTLIPPSASAYTDSTKVVTGSKAGTAESFTFNRDSTTGNYILPIASVGIGDGNKLVLNIPYGWTLKVEQTDGGYYITTPTITYGDQATPAVQAGTAYPTSGKEILVNTDIVINNVANNITIEGVTDSNNHNWIIYILAAVAGLAAIGAGIFLWKKKDEFVEQ